MKKDTPFTITEWDWFKVQLTLLELRRSASMFGVSFNIKDEDGMVRCSIYHRRLEDVLRDTPDKEELLDRYFLGWTSSQKNALAEILEGIPTLKKEFDLEKDVVFQIMHDYGMGASVLCKIIGNEIEWSEGIYQSLKERFEKSPITVIEKAFLKRFERFADYLRDAYSDADIRVYALDQGVLTNWQGYGVSLECNISSAARPYSSRVSLMISAFHIHTEPMLIANVEWGQPYDVIGTRWSSEPALFSDESVAKLELDLPNLFADLEDSIRRGYPKEAQK